MLRRPLLYSLDDLFACPDATLVGNFTGTVRTETRRPGRARGLRLTAASFADSGVGLSPGLLLRTIRIVTERGDPATAYPQTLRYLQLRKTEDAKTSYLSGKLGP